MCLEANKICKQCNTDLPRKRLVFCSSSCAAKYNNVHRVRKNAKLIRFCKNCGKGIKNKIYCSTKCQGEFKSKETYKKFLLGEINSINLLSYSPVAAKKYILKEQNCKCTICGAENKWNGKELIFILDHIDGNSQNNRRNNLRLVCPNCDTQLDTFKSKNKGSGRHFRLQRRNEGKSF